MQNAETQVYISIDKIPYKNYNQAISTVIQIICFFNMGKTGMGMWIAPIFGLIGALLGAIISLITSRFSLKDNLNRELAVKKEELNKKFAEPLNTALDNLHKEQRQCIQISSSLSRIEHSCSSKALELYENSDLYPVIQIDFYENYNPSLVWGSLDNLLGDLNVCLNIYNEARNSHPIDKGKMRLVIGEIHKCVVMAIAECGEEQISLVNKINDKEIQVLQNALDSYNEYRNQVMGKKIKKDKDVK